jgi:hypothetical protein
MKTKALWAIATCSVVELVMEAARTSETSVNFKKTTRNYVPEGCHLKDSRDLSSTSCLEQSQAALCNKHIYIYIFIYLNILAVIYFAVRSQWYNAGDNMYTFSGRLAHLLWLLWLSAVHENCSCWMVVCEQCII